MPNSGDDLVCDGTERTVASARPLVFEMDLIFFETVVVAVTVEDRLLIALFDGSMSDPPTKSACVALLSCEMETGAALSDALCSLLKTQSGQAHDES